MDGTTSEQKKEMEFKEMTDTDMGQLVDDNNCPVCGAFMSESDSNRWRAKLTCGECDLVLFDRSKRRRFVSHAEKRQHDGGPLG